MLGRTNAIGGAGIEFVTGTITAKPNEIMIPCPKEPAVVVCYYFYNRIGWSMASCGGFVNGKSTNGMGIRRGYNESSGELIGVQLSPSATYYNGYVTMSSLYDYTGSAYTWNYYIAY